jgi:DNA invertase Pin-like site-specific DNA recombinase
MNGQNNLHYVAYYRVSTARQGKSGLGLDAQRQAVLAHLRDAKPIHEFVEVESGRRADRPRLKEALTACRLHKATLIIAKLDRLARNVAFVSNLLDSGVDFVAVDFPQANRLTIYILAAVAENEARMISDRTRLALQGAKARGTVLGGYRGRAGTCTDCATARSARISAAEKRMADLWPTISAIQEEGCGSLRSIAKQLDARCVPAPRGGTWSASQVKRVLTWASSSFG